MVLVTYSDSEDSGDEQISAQKAAPKRLDRAEGNKIKVNLPSSKPEASTDHAAEPASKKQRTAGAFSGFNSLLPAPKRAAQNSSLKSGISLRTSSEAAFSRVPAPRLDVVGETRDAVSHVVSDLPVEAFSDDTKEEPKLVGKTTRFLPLSVANAKKKKRPPVAAAMTVQDRPTAAKDKIHVPTQVSVEAHSKAQTNRSLFSMQDAESGTLKASAQPYEPEFVQLRETTTTSTERAPAESTDPALNGVVSDLNLSASEQRRLFGRRGNGTNVNIAHFDMNAEYRSNQELAAKGEAVEHRAVKAIAPGKHNLQQLLNNVRGQSDALEDKWADGRRQRGESGSKYGWKS